MTDPSVEETRSERLERAIRLLESVRLLCLRIIVLFVAIGVMLLFMFDYMQGNRQRTEDLGPQIERTQVAAERVETAFAEFNSGNAGFTANHERTQRLICNLLRELDLPLPDNGDCDGR